MGEIGVVFYNGWPDAVVDAPDDFTDSDGVGLADCQQRMGEIFALEGGAEGDRAQPCRVRGKIWTGTDLGRLCAGRLKQQMGELGATKS